MGLARFGHKKRGRLMPQHYRNRAIEAVDSLGVPIPMRQAAVELIDSQDYEKAAKRAGVTADVVRGWAEDPLFIAAIGWLVVGLADNNE